MDLALLAPVALLLLALLLGRLERWLDASAPPLPPPEPRHRWRRPPRAARPGSVRVGAGRRLLSHRPRTGARPRPGAAAPVPRTARRQLLGGRPGSER